MGNRSVKKTQALALGDDGVSARDALRRELRRHRRPYERCTVSQWIERHLILPAGHGETHPGPVRFDKAPFLREVLDSLAMSGVTDVVFVAPTRMGKTLTLRCALAYFIAGEPSPILLYDATIDKARSLSKKELQPLINGNPVLRERKPRNRYHFSDTSMLMRGSFVNMYGGNSVAGAAGDTARVVLGNEVDKWSTEKDDEASMIELVRHRTESFDHERRHFFSSTPTTESGEIWRAYLKGDRRQWHPKCPDCGGFHSFSWDNVKWPEDCRNEDNTWDLHKVRATAFYLCPNCGSKWDDRKRLAAVQHPEAHWRPTAAPLVPGYRSYQLSGLCGWLTVSNIGELAVSFLESRTSSLFNDRRDFFNSRMGQPWLDVIADFDANKLKQRELDYERGKLPEDFKPDVIITGADVQRDHFWWVTIAYRWDGESRVIDHGQCTDWTDLDRVQKAYHRADCRSYLIIDSNYEARRAETYEAIFMRSDKGWIAANGVNHSSMLVKQGTQNPFIGDAKGREAAGAAITQVTISTYDFKVELEKRFSGELTCWRTYRANQEAGPHGEQMRQEQAEFYAQLMDERRKPRKVVRANQPKFEWVSKNGNNHYADCCVYSLALFWMLQRARTAVERDNARGGIHAATSKREARAVVKR